MTGYPIGTLSEDSWNYFYALSEDIAIQFPSDGDEFDWCMNLPDDLEELIDWDNIKWKFM